MSKLNKRDRTATPSSSNAAKTTTATDTSRELLKAHTKSIEAISGDHTVTSRFSETIWRNQRRDETRLARWRGRMANFASIRLIDKGGGGRATVKSPRFRFQLGYLARVGRNNLKDHHMVSLPRPRYLAAYRSTPMGPVRGSNRMEIRVKSAGGCRSHLGWKLIRENAISIRPRPQIQLRQYLWWPTHCRIWHQQTALVYKQIPTSKRKLPDLHSHRFQHRFWRNRVDEYWERCRCVGKPEGHPNKSANGG